jgi:hypothetical protein
MNDKNNNILFYTEDTTFLPGTQYILRSTLFSRGRLQASVLCVWGVGRCGAQVRVVWG